MIADSDGEIARAPQFTIVTPSFQNSEWLRLCVASVADQAQVSVEHIVQDAGSSDGTAEWLRGDSRVRAFIEDDAGMYDAINRGLSRARGSICAYLNCDEQLLPNALARVGHYFETHADIDVVFGDAILINDAGIPLSYRRAVLPKRQHVRLSHLNTLSCATFFRRSLVEKGFFFDPNWRVIGDAVWIETLLRSGVRMGTLRQPLAVFTFTGKNLGASPASQEESARRRPPAGVWSGLQKLIAVMSHRVRKLLAGAYWRRHVQVEIYTRQSLSSRQRLERTAVGFSWPRL